MKVSLDRVQRSGVRTEPAQTRILVQPVRAVGTVAIDERRLTIVTLRSEGYIEDLFVNTTGQTCASASRCSGSTAPQIQQARPICWWPWAPCSAASWEPMPNAPSAARCSGCAISASRRTASEEVREDGHQPAHSRLAGPADGSVIGKRIINGQRVAAGDELYRIADLSTSG